MSNFTEKLKAYLHDPIDKCFYIPNHEERAQNYAEQLGISDVKKAKGPDQIASCMERSLLPEGIIQDFNEIRHPLSNGSIVIKDDEKKINFQSIIEAYKKIGKNISKYDDDDDDDKKKFLFLWRNLQDELFEKLKDELWIKYLPLLPADTRVPDHSIWEHLKIASSINAYGGKELYQKNSLFLFTIGPVQSFISQARKTQDFYMGSFILSFFTFRAMEVIIDKYGPTNIIYPDLYKQPLMDLWLKKNGIDPTNFDENSIELPTIPNRFVAILPETKKDEITNLANEMKNKIIDTIEEAKKCIFKKLGIAITQALENKINSQLSEFPEIYWVAIPWKIDGSDICFDDLKEFFDKEALDQYLDLLDFAIQNGEFPPNIGLLYELLYSALEKSMGARKNLREFRQIGEKGRKCSVCGERDVIFFRETANKNKFLRFNPYAIDLTDNEKVSLKFLADGEGLCAICFLKRTFEIYLEKDVSKVFDDLTFPSTAEVALADFKERALNKANKEFSDFQEKFREISKDKFPKVKPLPKIVSSFRDKENLEGAWFFEENLTEKRLKEDLEIEGVGEREIRELRDALTGIINKVVKPNPYYALLYLDGDNMGKWLSGELLPNIEYAYNSEVLERIRNMEAVIKEDNKEVRTIFIEGLKKYLPRKLLTPAIHASISTALRNYTIEFVKKIVEEEHLGKLVYAGGDDVLAFVNLKDLFDVMQKLRWAFSGQIKFENGEIKVDLSNKTGFVEKDGRYLLTMGPEATASMGVVIAHYKTPLQIVIQKVFEMAKKAKKEDKNRFAICLMKRSGEERMALAKWKYDDKDTIETLKEIAKSFDEENEKGYIAKGFIQKFALEFKHLKDEKGTYVGIADIIKQELSRLLNRSFNSPKDRRISKEERRKFIENLCNKMNELFYNIGENLDYFVNFCIIATFIHKGED